MNRGETCTNHTGALEQMHPINVLFLAANPFAANAALRLDEEVRAINEAIMRGRTRDSLVFHPRFAVRVSDVQQAFLDVRPTIVHFGGHGDPKDGIYLQDDRGGAAPVVPEALANLLSVFRTHLRMVVLTACSTTSSVEATRAVVEFSIGMQRPISDLAAIQFSAALYGALSSGTTVGEAFALGRNRLEMVHPQEATTPVLAVGRNAQHDAVLAPARPKTRDAETGPGIRIRDIRAGTVEIVNGDAVFNNKGIGGSAPGDGSHEKRKKGRPEERA